MKHLFVAAVVVLLSCLSNQTHAQTLSSVTGDVAVAKALTIDNESSSWAFYADEENKKYYIDFEKLHIYLDKIEVLDADGKIVFSDNLFNLPPNALYELDCTPFTAGQYTLRLKSLLDENMTVAIDVK
jgi:hypothetical protein